MSDELNSNDELKKLDTNRRKKVDNFNLNISGFDDNDDDDIIFPDELEDDSEPNSVSQNDLDNFAVPSRKGDDDEQLSEKEEEKRRKLALKAEKKRKKKKAKKNGCVFRVVWAVLVIILGVFLAEFLLVGINDLLGRNREVQLDEDGNEKQSSIIIQIPDNATVDTVADILYENGVISSESYFKLYAKITKHGMSFNKGSYEMKNDMDYEAIINYLQSDLNRVDTVSLQFTEGMTVLEIADKLAENEVCNKELFLKLCNSNEFDEDFTFLSEGRKNVAGTYYKLEGYLFPDTYEFYKGENAKTSIYRFLNDYESRVYYTKYRIEIKEDDSNTSSENTDSDKSKRKTKKYEKLTIEEQAKKQGMTMDEVMIIASMVQAEAADTEDMKIISSIFHNRLATLDKDGYTAFGENINGTLGSDPTVFYPYKQNTVPNNFESKYDTYKIKGLPAGADCNPGLDAIEAAIYPADTTYYFFCHKPATDEEPAKAYYASTLADQEYNMSLAGLK
ncbi:MAG: endolytic transglycosylase MltG [Clostridia bacterium]|nr:endolytic transglycosylase MltG [Clostridia bacterium]